MKQDRRGCRRSAGFTLVEMLVVVALIAVLAAVSVPLVSGALDKARERVDEANRRAATTAALAAYLMAGETRSVIYFYRSDGAVLPEDELLFDSVAGTPGYDYGQSRDNRGSCVSVRVASAADGTMSVEAIWEKLKR